MAKSAKPKFRRGFVAEADSLSLDFRNELKLKPESPLCPWQLAKLLDIPILELTDHRATIPDSVVYLTEIESSSFSAVTVICDIGRVIVHNSSHHIYRQASNIAHELAHAILDHPQSPPINENGDRNYDAEIEREANWLGAALLISAPAAKHILKNGISIATASQIYKVSQDLINMRINVTGARIIQDRINRKYTNSQH